MTTDRQNYTIRVPGQLIERADALGCALEGDQSITAVTGGRVSRSAMLRLAMLGGLTSLEKKHRRKAK